MAGPGPCAAPSPRGVSGPRTQAAAPVRLLVRQGPHTTASEEVQPTASEEVQPSPSEVLSGDPEERAAYKIQAAFRDYVKRASAVPKCPVFDRVLKDQPELEVSVD